MTEDSVPRQDREADGFTVVELLMNPLRSSLSAANVSVANGLTGAAWHLILASHSTSGRCFALLEQPGNAPQFQRVDNRATCQADQFTPTTGWLTAWP